MLTLMQLNGLKCTDFIFWSLTFLIPTWTAVVCSVQVSYLRQSVVDSTGERTKLDILLGNCTRQMTEVSVCEPIGTSDQFY